MSGTSTGANHSSAVQCSVDDMRDSSGRSEGAIRRTAVEKQCIDVGPRPTFFKVGHDRLTHFLGQRQSGGAAALTTNGNRRALPVDFTQAKIYDIARPKT